MRFRGAFLGLCAVALLAACDDNPDVVVNPTTGAGGGTSPVAVASVTIVPSVLLPIQIGVAEPFDATALDAQNVPISGATFTWTSSDPSVANIVASGSGATATLNALAVGTTNVSATSGGITSALVPVTVTCAGIPSAISDPTASPGTISTFGNSSISVTVTDCNSNPVSGVQITFSVSPATLGSVTATPPSSPTTNTNTGGAATATFTAGGVGGTASVRATTGSITSNPVSIPITTPTAGSIRFKSAVPQVIGVKGSGQEETSRVTFDVRDVTGNPVANGTQVNFSMAGPNCTSVFGTAAVCPSPVGDPNDEYIDPIVASTVNGEATTIINSGKVAGVVTVTAAVAGTNISTSATGVSIGGGIPSADNFQLSVSKVNIGGHVDLGGYDDLELSVTAHMADRFGNKNVLGGSSVSFYTEAGHLFSSGITGAPSLDVTADASGSASVRLISQGTIPINVYPSINIRLIESSSQIDLIWEAPIIFYNSYAGVVYDVYRNTAYNRIPTSAYTLLPFADATTGWEKRSVGQVGTTFTDVGLTNGNTYYYFVVARDASGRVGDTPVLAGTPRASGGIESSRRPIERAHAEIYQYPAVIPVVISTRLRNPRDGRVSILAVTRGEELFFDAPQSGLLSGNGVYDLGETFVDMPGEPFLDADDNGVYNPPESFTDLDRNGIYDEGEPFNDSNGNGRYDYGDPFFIDTNHDGIWNGPNGVWDGPGCPAPTCLSQPMISRTIKIGFTGQMDVDNETITGSAPFNTAPRTTSRIEILNFQDPGNPDQFQVPNGQCASFNIYVSDANLNRLSAGSVITVTAPVGKLTGQIGLTLADGLPTGPTILGVALCDSDSQQVKVEGTSIDVLVAWKNDPHPDTVFSMSVPGIMDFPPALSINTGGLPAGQDTVAYNATLSGSGGLSPYNWSITAGALPPGLALDAATGAITGTPPAGTSAGSPYAFTVQLSDSFGSTPVPANLSITINP